MKEKRLGVTMFLSIGLICMLAISCYVLFFNKSPGDKKPQDDSSHSIEELRQEIIHIKHDGNKENRVGDIHTGQASNADIYVREIPIPLDPEMEEHLELFRKKARLLVQEFPESFFISMAMTELGAVEKTIALTFDDGPDNSSTMEVVNVLNEYGIPGTFFLIGQQMNQFSDTIKTILADGHTIANHSWSHVRPTDIIDKAVLLDEVAKAQLRIEAHDVTTKLYRPPYGLVTETQMPALIEAGYQVIGWSIDSMDWYFDDPDQIVTCVVENAHPGAVVLMHSAGGHANRKATIEALPIIIETLQKEGYRFVSLP